MKTFNSVTSSLKTNTRDPLRQGSHPRWLFWAVWSASVVQALFGLVLAALNSLTLSRLFVEFVPSEMIATLAFATVGLVIGVRQPSNIIGWFFSALGTGHGLNTWLVQYTRYTFVTQPGTLPFGEFIAWLTFWVWVPTMALTMIFLPVFFPNGRLPSRNWRPFVCLATLGTILLSISLAFTPGLPEETLPEVQNPFVLDAGRDIFHSLNVAGLILVSLSFVGGIVGTFLRFMRAQGVERLQFKWFAFATFVTVTLFLVPVIINYPDFTQATFLTGVLHAIALPLLPIATMFAILRYRLYDIDIIIHRTLVYASLTGLIVALYVLIVGYLGALFRAASDFMVSLIATGVIAVIFQPLRAWLQQAVGRVLYGQRDEPYEVLARLGERLKATIAPDAVLPTVALSVKEALKLPFVAVTLESDGDYIIAAAEGTIVPHPLVLPLVYQGVQVGQLLVAPRAPREEWSASERGLLEHLAQHAGVAVHGVRLMRELQQAREKLILAREEERRRLRRDLHDDLAPSLAALALTAAAVKELIHTDPKAATVAAEKLRSSIRLTVADVRRLVYDLRPPTLDEFGLTGAIREHAAKFSADTAGMTEQPLAVKVAFSNDLPNLPAAVEVAVYRIVQEALMNVSRHAQASSCEIHLCYDAIKKEVHLIVLDDGVGLPAERRPGVGLRSMWERTTELGGTYDITRREPAGTRVSAVFPLARHQGARKESQSL
ncbi:GAF domain-containing sensor histidine kinase [Deinococcus peraridilitoris]|uniref:Histidine kinase n=1 Tax=Deinococcus peraridilitoris (strain DSM 19664 / LMG 22246 / CIP 109416 / KR-200) TaxID=937777 RepID=L0A8N7_DEIPD|nr:GAF domain-containing sensor histidine kinase [Deinococcus peraridilitoris]AFZ69784.1 histidine kinase [Deinococcus peraridilitoris DSM 19664]